MGDMVGNGKERLGKVRVTEFVGIGEHQGLGGDVHDMKAEVVVEVGANVEAVMGSKVLIIASVGLVVDEEFSSKGSKWCGVVAMGDVEVLPGIGGRISCGLAE